jgi:hypothetical protein
MRNWAACVIWAGMALSGSVVASVGQDRWLIAGGGAVVGVSLMAGVTLLLWSLVLRRLVRWLRELFHDLHDLREFIEGRIGWERSGRIAPNVPPDRYSSSNTPWRW